MFPECNVVGKYGGGTERVFVEVYGIVGHTGPFRRMQSEVGIDNVRNPQHRFAANSLAVEQLAERNSDGEREKIEIL